MIVQVLLTGATGFIGAAILRRLSREDLAIRVLVRETSDRFHLKNIETEICVGDLGDKASLQNAMKGCDALIHTAAEYRLWTSDPNGMVASNITGTANILSAAGDAGVSNIVYTSSVAALGKAAGGEPVTESTPSKLEDKIGLYKRSKFLAEQEVLHIHQAQGLPVKIVNPSAPIGPGDIKPTPTGRLVVEAAKGKVPAYVESGLNVVHVDDVAEGHLLALHKGVPGEKYILGGENLTLLEVLTHIATAAGVRPPMIRVPHNIVLPIAYMSEAWAKWVTGKEPFTTVDGVNMSRKPMYFSSKKAIDDLGYAPRPIISAFQESVDWFRSRGYLG
ncbi:MAG: NAD-dependent epimerase/dehydratase family protein [Rhodospirillales bacterium]|nr:NAD-dependent epimerase/dehydratase family protein [Rhodospirillales bacterium]